jgi:di/tricarboxylate transporter
MGRSRSAPRARKARRARGRSRRAAARTASRSPFLTPIGHHGNLLAYGPGRYQFADFVRVGAPLTLLVALVVAFMAPWLWHS